MCLVCLRLCIEAEFFVIISFPLNMTSTWEIKTDSALMACQSKSKKCISQSYWTSPCLMLSHICSVLSQSGSNSNLLVAFSTHTHIIPSHMMKSSTWTNFSFSWYDKTRLIISNTAKILALQCTHSSLVMILSSSSWCIKTLGEVKFH